MLLLLRRSKRVLQIAVVVGLTACSGDTGPAGALGPQGPEGPQGPAGPIGTANVRQFNFGSFTHSGGEEVRDIPVTSADAAQSLFFIYVRTPANFTYPIPGSIGLTVYRSYFNNPTATTTRIRMTRSEGQGEQEFAAMRIIVVRAGTVTSLPLDWGNYEEVAAHFGIKE